MIVDTDRDDTDLRVVQRRTVRTLVIGQILGGLGIGATLSIGAVLATAVSGSEAFAGAAATLSTLGAAAAAIPLARLTKRFGRRTALAAGTVAAMIGAMTIVVATAWIAFPLLLVGFALLGVGAAVGLQSRFAATDLADATTKGRDLSIVVWSSTVGAVVGPNLFGPGEVVGEQLGMPPLTGSFVFAVAAQLAAALVYLIALRPDPYLASRGIPPPPSEPGGSMRAKRLVIFAVATLATSHTVMVSVMAMTPVHLVHHGASLPAVGATLSLHIAGMFALSPLFGWLSDRFGRLQTILVGQGFFAASLVTLALGQADTAMVTGGLILLGLGWSASTVSASALIAELVLGDVRPKVQGRADLAMNVAGAGGGALAGPVLALVGYAGLATVAGGLVAVIVVWASLVAGRVARRLV